LGWENGKDMIARGRSLAAERRDGRLGTWTLGRLLRRFRVDRKQLKGKNNKRQLVSYSIFYVRPLFSSAAGDMRRGQSLIVWAINEGRAAARECDRFLMGTTKLP